VTCVAARRLLVNLGAQVTDANGVPVRPLYQSGSAEGARGLDHAITDGTGSSRSRANPADTPSPIVFRSARHHIRRRPTSMIGSGSASGGLGNQRGFLSELMIVIAIIGILARSRSRSTRTCRPALASPRRSPSSRHVQRARGLAPIAAACRDRSRPPTPGTGPPSDP
jgi:prepilin-type N-terminal cleavage/methylation domain-containing protein